MKPQNTKSKTHARKPKPKIDHGKAATGAVATLIYHLQFLDRDEKQWRTSCALFQALFDLVGLERVAEFLGTALAAHAPEEDGQAQIADVMIMVAKFLEFAGVSPSEAIWILQEMADALENGSDEEEPAQPVLN